MSPDAGNTSTEDMQVTFRAAEDGIASSRVAEQIA
jgi:hypothetical protein